ncbi:MAG: protein phosphatase 2C domain-containing protein [Prevotellaceae bacterium]|jgi:protein phosphatase|nr:protein phosphatase 2C domain-containing protein [Prevotellaceae bacterium]
METPLKILGEGVCDVGCVRSNNEDMLLLGTHFVRDGAVSEEIVLTPASRLAALVADGIGGNEGGEIASELALYAFGHFVGELPAGLSDEELFAHIRTWASQTHHCFLTDGSEELRGQMGTTLVGLLFYEGAVCWLNIGDSRLYRYRGGILKQLTTDHSMRALTGCTDTPSNLIYNSLGAGDKVFVDLQPLTGQLFEGDSFLICSDGLSDLLTDEELASLLAAGGDASLLVEAAKRAGGRDNVTALLLRVQSA